MAEETKTRTPEEDAAFYKSELEKVINQRQEFKTQALTANERADALAREIESLKARPSDKGNGKSDGDEEIKKQVAEMNERFGKRENLYRENLRQATVMRDLAMAAASEGALYPDVAVGALEKSFDIEEKDGAFTVKPIAAELGKHGIFAMTETGKFKTPDEVMKEWLSKRPGLVKNQIPGGAGTGGAGGATGGNSTAAILAKVNQMSMADQNAWIADPANKKLVAEFYGMTPKKKG